jgi:DNA-directed RNA polymerase specialized sigma24 family protein
MAHDPAVADVESFLAERGEPLLRTAVLLTGSKEAGEDLLQAGLERLLRHWSAIVGDPEGYLRRTLYNLAADGWRRQRAWRRRLPLLQQHPPAVFPGSGRVGGWCWFQLAVAGRLHASLDLSRLHRALLVHGQRAAGLRLGHHPGERNHRSDLRERHLVDRAGPGRPGRDRAGARLHPGLRD